MQKIVLHIGMHKTGTTSIQKWLCSHPERLARHGILYPEAGVPHGLFGHHHLAWILKGDARSVGRRDWWREMVDEIRNSPCRTAVVSSEDFEFLPPSSIQAIAHVLRELEVTIVIYVRRPDLLVESTFATAVMHGSAHKSPLDFYNCRRQPFCFRTLADRWAESFGVDSICLRPRLSDTDTVADFLGILGIQTDAGDLGARDNQAGSASLTRHMLYINQRPEAIALEPRERRDFLPRMRSLARRFSEDGPPGRFLSYAAAKDILMRHARTYAYLEEQYGVRELQTEYAVECLQPYDAQSTELSNPSVEFLERVRELCMLMGKSTPV